MASTATTTITVLGEGGTGVVKLLLQGNGHTQCDFKPLGQTLARDLIGIDIGGRHTAFLLGSAIAVEQTLMHRCTKLEQDISASHTDETTDANASKSTGIQSAQVSRQTDLLKGAAGEERRPFEDLDLIAQDLLLEVDCK